MKLLFDEHLSPRLVERLRELFPDSVSVFDVNLMASGDIEIWKYAMNNDFTIVSKDSDFYIKSAMYHHPPKVIYLTIGNCTVSVVEQLLRRSHQKIMQFDYDDEKSLLVL